MKDEFVSLRTAKLARKKGLDTQLDLGGNCVCYKKDGAITSYHVHFEYPDRNEYIYAPTQAFLARWTRMKFDIHIEIYCNASGWGWILTKLNGTTIKEIRDDIFFATYEEAFEIGLLSALKLIKL
jgi:hypothetical protein